MNGGSCSHGDNLVVKVAVALKYLASTKCHFHKKKPKVLHNLALNRKYLVHSLALHIDTPVPQPNIFHSMKCKVSWWVYFHKGNTS